MSQVKRFDDPDLPMVNLHPGELFVAREPTIITTILGSCVSVCLYCPRRRIGAMCHGVMPSRDEKFQQDSFRFVDSSVSYMAEVLTRGAEYHSRSTLVAKLFGGADVLKVRGRTAALSMGTQNIAAARQALERQGIGISAERVGGKHGYRLYFYTHTGEVYVRLVKRPGGAQEENGNKN